MICRGGGALTLPAIDPVVLDAHKVQGAADDVAHHVVDALRFGVKGGHGRHDVTAQIGGAAHQAEMAFVERRFAHHQDHRAAFFEAHVGGADHQVVGKGTGDSRKRFDRARRDDHAPRLERTAGHSCAHVFVGIGLGGQGLDVVKAQIGFQGQRAQPGFGDDQVGGHTQITARAQGFNTQCGTRCAGDADDQGI